MTPWEQESFERELARLRPAPVPSGLLERLADARFSVACRVPPPSRVRRGSWLRLLLPASSLAALVVFVVRSLRWAEPDVAGGVQPRLIADEVRLDRQFVQAFDTLARLPGGEPVRVRCEEWVDTVAVTDSARGVVVEQRRPRLELVGVQSETF